MEVKINLKEWWKLTFEWLIKGKKVYLKELVFVKVLNVLRINNSKNGKIKPPLP